MMNRQDKSEISIRGYKSGDEDAIVDFLNLGYSTQASNLQDWRWRHVDYPTFKRDNDFIVEANNKMVGYRGLFLRDMVISGNRLVTASLGATATHPDFRGYGIYSRLHQATLQAALSQGSIIAITWNSRGSITYNHNIKTGFVPIKQLAYIRIINHHKVLEKELRKFIAGNSKARALFEDFKHELSIGIDNQTLSIAKILDEDSSSSEARRKVRILLTESAIPLLLMLRKGRRFQRVRSLMWLVLLRKVKIRGDSPISFLRFAWKGVRLFV